MNRKKSVALVALVVLAVFSGTMVVLYAKKDTPTTTTIQYVNSINPSIDDDFGWTHTFDKKAFQKILLVTLDIKAFDVDYDDENWPVGPYSEINLVFVDGVLVGSLVGGNDERTITTFKIPSKLLKDGELNVWIDIDSAKDDSRDWSYGASIDWSRVIVVSR